MNRKISWIPLTSVLALSVFACQFRESEEVKVLRWVEKADPIADVKAAISRGDHRLLAVRGLTVSLPGTDRNDLPRYEAAYGVKQIEGTTDGLVNQEHGRLVQRATDYAKAYNLFMIHECKLQGLP